MGLDRNEIADELRRDITTGKYLAGDKLPGYRTLATQFGAAINTVGEAVRLLASENLVTLNANSPARVNSLDDAVQTDEDRIGSARAELLGAQTAIGVMREQLEAVDKRVADALSTLRA